jgi:hypothetical protein
LFTLRQGRSDSIRVHASLRDASAAVPSRVLGSTSTSTAGNAAGGNQVLADFFQSLLTARTAGAGAAVPGAGSEITRKVQLRHEPEFCSRFDRADRIPSGFTRPYGNQVLADFFQSLLTARTAGAGAAVPGAGTSASTTTSSAPLLLSWRRPRRFAERMYGKGKRQPRKSVVRQRRRREPSPRRLFPEPAHGAYCRCRCRCTRCGHERFAERMYGKGKRQPRKSVVRQRRRRDEVIAPAETSPNPSRQAKQSVQLEVVLCWTDGGFDTRSSHRCEYA